MMYPFAVRKVCRTAAYSVALALASLGCQHMHPATTQIASTEAPDTGVANAGGAGNSGGSNRGGSNSGGPNGGISNTGTSIAGASNTGASNAGNSGTGVSNTGVSNTGASNTGGSNAVGANTGVTNTGGVSTGGGTADNGASTGQTSGPNNRGVAGSFRNFGTSSADLATNSFVRIRNTPPESLSAPIIDVDEAMQARDWDRATATYSSGATVAGPIGFLYQPRSDQSAWRYQVIELPLFLGNTALLPFAFARTLPWKPVEWKASTVEPTYTGVPPLPPQ